MTWARRIAGRAAAAIPLLWLAATALFVVFLVVPGDPVSVLSGDQPITAEVRQSIEREYGLDRPLPVRYGEFLVKLVKGDLGQSYISGRPVAEVVAEALPSSLRLAFWALLIEVIAGVGGGVLAAAYEKRFADRAVRAVSVALTVTPIFLVAMGLQYLLGILPSHEAWGWRLPVQGLGPDSWALGVVPVGDQWRYLILPAVTLAGVTLALASRLSRAAMLDALHADYARTFRAMGVGRGRIVLRHALPNALAPVIAFLGVDLGRMLGSAVLVETIFGWPGVGGQIQAALVLRDAPVVIGFTLVLVVAFVLFNLAADLAGALVDPRVDSARPFPSPLRGGARGGGVGGARPVGVEPGQLQARSGAPTPDPSPRGGGETAS